MTDIRTPASSRIVPAARTVRVTAREERLAGAPKALRFIGGAMARLGVVSVLLTGALVIASESSASAQLPSAQVPSPAASPNKRTAAPVSKTPAGTTESAPVLSGANAAAAGNNGGVASTPVSPNALGQATTQTVDVPAEVLTGAEMRARGANAIRAITASKQQIGVMLAAAREKRDVVKVLCLSDKREQVEVALSTANDRQTSLIEALDIGGGERSTHEYTLLTVLKERVDALTGEAGQCIGEETGFTGDSELSVQVDPNLPDSETSNAYPPSEATAAPSLSSAGN